MEDVDNFSSVLFRLITECTLCINKLANSDLSFYRTIKPELSPKLDSLADRILTQANLVIQQQQPAQQNESSMAFETLEDVTDNFGLVVDTVDNMLEKIDFCLDFINGKVDNSVLNSSMMQQAEPISTPVQVGEKTFSVLHAQNVSRPQMEFKDKVDNSNTLSAPRIKVKENAKYPLPDYSLEENYGIHPYEKEIKELEYSADLFEEKKEILYNDIESTAVNYIETEEELEELAKLLCHETEFAVDLENHNYRSFQGFSCLMQISTRSADYIIDVIELRQAMHVLNSSFTDPNIIKVFHGPESDIQWLQRDFGIYVVNLFDTFQASKLLEMPGNSLAYLLSFYCNVTADKKYQLADWRIRPIPKEMLKYAQEDTHYLLYIYDRMRNELLKKGSRNLVLSVLKKGEKYCLKMYQKDIYDDNSSWIGTLQKYNIPLNSQQLHVFKALHKWRDHIAREEDESIHYVYPNHVLFKLATHMPTESTKLLGLCSPLPPFVRLYATDLALLIAKAKKEVGEIVIPKVVKAQHVKFEEEEVDEAETVQAEEIIMKEYNPIIDEFESFIACKVTIAEGKISSFGALLQATLSDKSNEVFAAIKQKILCEPLNIPVVAEQEEKRPLEMEVEPIAAVPQEKSEPIILSGKKSHSQPSKKMKKSKEVEPFDYSNASTDAAEAPNVSSSRSKVTPFNPFNKIVEDPALTKKERTLSVNPKSGNRSMTFKK